MKLNDFIWIKRNELSEEFCQHCIEKFEKDDNRQQGLIRSGVDLNTKQSTDLKISDLDGWKEEDNIFFDSLTSNLEPYLDDVPYAHEVIQSPQDTGYQIQRTDPGGFYTWHQDQWTNRRITFIWYLNDVIEDGYTEFSTGYKVQPETGKMLMFPALWPWVHRGFPPKSEVKYICTGWLYSTITDEETKNLVKEGY